MRRLLMLSAVIISVLPSGFAVGEADQQSKYAGQEQRNIKSLSPEDIRELRSGGGWGLAKAAELNGVPGPAHLLELKDKIPLTPMQVTKASAIYEEMKARAISQGERLIDLERQLESFFRNRATSDTRLRALLSEIAEIRGRLRYTHLSTHLAVSEFLSEPQIARYNMLRGYEGNPCGGLSEGKDAPHGIRHHHCD